MYTGKLKLDEDNVREVLVAANYIQMTNIVKHCCQFMKETVTPSNCLQYLEFAEVYTPEDNLVQTIESCLLTNFKIVSQDPAFLEVSEQALCKFLKSDHILCQEMEILQVCRFFLS